MLRRFEKAAGDECRVVLFIKGGPKIVNLSFQQLRKRGGTVIRSHRFKLLAREELKAVRTDYGTTSFPKLLKGQVDDFWTALYEKYDTAFVPGRFFESPQHLRIGMCAEPEFFKIGVERLGKALDELAG